MKLPKTPPVAVAFAAFAALVGAAFGAPAARAVEAPPLRLTIAFTGDVSGYLEPCG